MDTSSVVLLIAVLVTVISFMSSAIVYVGRILVYDESPALVVRAVEPVTTVLKSGDPFRYYLAYDKRMDCEPPLGSSEISYRVWSYQPNEVPTFVWLDYARPSRAPPGRNQRLATPSTIPLPHLAPGPYGFQFRAIYHCKNSSGPQTIDGPIVKFAVVQ